MSQFDLNQLSKKNQEFIRIPNTNCLKMERQRKKQKASSRKFYQLSMKTKEKEFRHGPFWSSNCMGELFQRERTL